jgi:nitrite reductase/ring-hydroxylating ferredoxin subunit
MRTLCEVSEIEEGGARGFGPPPGGFTGLFAVRDGAAIRVYVNSCPHLGVPLDWTPHQFRSEDGSRIVCSTHGAAFGLHDGVCISGPCLGETLRRVMIEIKDGCILVPEDAGLSSFARNRLLGEKNACPTRCTP